MKPKKLLTLLLTSTMLLTIAVGFVGCKKDKVTVQTNTEKVSTDTSPKKDEDQHLNLRLFQPLTLDPNEAQDSSSFMTLNAMHEGLVRIKVVDEKDTIVPAGATSWETSDDGLTWTFHLRDYKWSDGVAVTAGHYVDSFRRLLKKDNAFPYAYFAYDIKGAEAYNLGKGKVEDVGVVAKDDKTLVITLCRPTPYFEKKISFKVFLPVRLDVIKNGGENWKTDHTKQVYCGPYKIKEWVKDNSMTFEKNPTFWDAENVSINTVKMDEMKELSTRSQLFESKQLDLIGSSKEYIQKWQDMAKKGEFKSREGDQPTIWYLGFNNEGGPSKIMSNKKIRLAMSLAFDRKDYIDTLFNRFTPAYGYIPKALQCGKDEFRDVANEPLKDLQSEYLNKPEKLQALLKEGLKELGQDTTDLKKIKVKFMAVDAGTEGKQENEWWEQQLEKNLGIDVVVEVHATEAIYEQAKKDKNWDLTVSGWAGDFDDPITFLDFFTGKNDNNFVMYKNPEYNKLFNELATELDDAKRLEKYTRLEEMLIKDDAALSPIFYQDKRTFVHNYVKDFMFPTFGADYEWRWAYTSGRK